MTSVPDKAMHADTAREFLVVALGDAHVQHTVVAKNESAKGIGARCSCGATVEFYLAEPMGKRAQAALRNVPDERELRRGDGGAPL